MSSLIKHNPKKNINWYLLQTKYNQEKRAAEELKRQNITVFLPFYRCEKIIRGKRVTREEPLFKRYVFAYLDIEITNWTSVRSTRGISNVVSFGDGPAIVDESIVKNLKNEDLSLKESYFKSGEKIRVIKGSLNGLSAIFQNEDGASRSYILLDFMRQNQLISVENKLIKKF